MKLTRKSVRSMLEQVIYLHNMQLFINHCKLDHHYFMNIAGCQEIPIFPTFSYFFSNSY